MRKKVGVKIAASNYLISAVQLHQSCHICSDCQQEIFINFASGFT